jgi:hypothetical protein
MFRRSERTVLSLLLLLLLLLLLIGVVVGVWRCCCRGWRGRNEEELVATEERQEGTSQAWREG